MHFRRTASATLIATAQHEEGDLPLYLEPPQATTMKIVTSLRTAGEITGALPMDAPATTEDRVLSALDRLRTPATNSNTPLPLSDTSSAKTPPTNSAA